MRLISCHIENYGCIRNFDCKFDETLTSVCERNGYGKTTLASFLKAMFYGLDMDRSNSAFNERRHFFPFGGGAFGGNLTFEAGGDLYKIERFFDEKSETKDSFVLYRNNVPLPDASSAVGQRFFGIDRASFERTVFVSGADLKISSSDDINKKLSTFVEGDDSDLGIAQKILEAKRKEYKAGRGTGGLISSTQTRLGEIGARIKNIETIAASLIDKNARYEALTRQIIALTQKISAAQSENVLFTHWESYDRMVEENAQTQEKLSAMNENYPFGLPLKGEISEVKEVLDEMRDVNTRLSHQVFGEEEAAQLHALEEEFAAGVPSEETLSDIQAAAEREMRISYDLERLGKVTLSQRETQLKQKFALRAPTEQEVEAAKANAEQYRAAEEKFSALPDFLTETRSAPAKKSKLPLLVVAILSVLLLAGGAATVFFSMIGGILLLVFGVFGVLAAGFLYLNGKMNAKASETAQRENPEKQAAKRSMDAIFSQIQALLVPYGYSFENGIPYAVASFVEDVKGYSELTAAEQERAERIGQLTEERASLRASLDDFFAKYSLALGDGDPLRTLRDDIASYRMLSGRNETWKKEQARLISRLEALKGELAPFCARYHLDADDVQTRLPEVEQDRIEHDRLQETLAAGQEKAERFRAEKGLSQRPEGEKADIDALNRTLGSLQDEKNSVYTEIMQDEREVEKLQDLQSEYEETQNRLEKYKADYELLGKVVDALDRADRAMKDRYIRPIREKFLFYATPLEEALGEKLVMDPNFAIRFERGGREHSEEHLSAGQHTLCALCFRLALIDNMYTAEKPFVILDDPFSTLDEEHLARAKALLARLAERMQILYFTCHKSRDI